MLGYSIFSNGGGAGGGGGGGGGGTVTESDVNFYDYDGTLVAAYTLAEAQALSALPSAPDHSEDTIPLTFQEWNFTLSAVNATTVKMDVGATYTTTDGKTWFHILVTTVSNGSVPFYFAKSNAADALEIDYGDGQTDSDSTNTSVTFTPSTALAVGHHWVSAWISSGSGTFSLGRGSTSTTVVGGYARGYLDTLVECFIGDNCTLGTYSFYDNRTLSAISIPSVINSIPDSCFQQNYSLKAIIIPADVTSIGSSAFNSCYSLATAILSEGVTIINGQSFYTCYSLTHIIIPSKVASTGSEVFYACFAIRYAAFCGSITTIGSGLFSNCYSILEYDFTACTSVPTLSSTSVFGNIKSVCIMYIPSALLSTWSTAANWSTYANYMEGV